MRPVLRILSASLLFVVLNPALHGADFDEAKLALIAPRMKRFVDEHQIAGAVTVVGNSKGTVRTDAIGDARLEPATPMPKDALFRIASMTKPITAVGIQILADGGKLSINDPVEKHLPEFRGQNVIVERDGERLILNKAARPITLHDLLTHTSGLPGYPPGLDDLYRKRNRTLADGVLAVSQRPLEFEPGTRWSYSNSGIDTLGRIIEVVSGKDYETFLSERVFSPLRMKDTTFRPNEEQVGRLAGLYAIKDDKLVAPANSILGPPKNAKHPMPAAGLYSTGADLARFYRMMLSGGTLDGERILTEEGAKAMTRVQTDELKCGFTPGMAHGLGFAVVRQPQGVTGMLSSGSFGHGGLYGTQSWADPKRDLFVILLIQRVGLPNSDATEMRHELQRLAVESCKP